MDNSRTLIQSNKIQVRRADLLQLATALDSGLTQCAVQFSKRIHLFLASNRYFKFKDQPCSRESVLKRVRLLQSNLGVLVERGLNSGILGDHGQIFVANESQFLEYFRRYLRKNIQTQQMRFLLYFIWLQIKSAERNQKRLIESAFLVAYHVFVPREPYLPAHLQALSSNSTAHILTNPNLSDFMGLTPGRLLAAQMQQLPEEANPDLCPIALHQRSKYIQVTSTKIHFLPDVFYNIMKPTQLAAPSLPDHKYPEGSITMKMRQKGWIRESVRTIKIFTKNRLARFEVEDKGTFILRDNQLFQVSEGLSSFEKVVPAAREAYLVVKEIKLEEKKKDSLQLFVKYSSAKLLKGPLQAMNVSLKGLTTSDYVELLQKHSLIDISQMASGSPIQFLQKFRPQDCKSKFQMTTNELTVHLKSSESTHYKIGDVLALLRVLGTLESTLDLAIEFIRRQEQFYQKFRNFAGTRKTVEYKFPEEIVFKDQAGYNMEISLEVDESSNPSTLFQIPPEYTQCTVEPTLTTKTTMFEDFERKFLCKEEAAVRVVPASGLKLDLTLQELRLK